jgi:hypothetical protein
MSSQIPDHYRIVFDANWRSLLQQEKHILEGTYEVKNIPGEIGFFDQIGLATMNQITQRTGRSSPQDISMPKRAVFPLPYDCTMWIDEFDHVALGDLPNPEGAMVRAHGYAANRTKDLICITALLGTSYTGKTGTTPVSLTAANQVAVNYVRTGSAHNSGMTLAKILQAKYLMDNANVPMDTAQRIMVVSPAQLQDLLNDVEQVSNDRYVDVKALIDGKVHEFGGFTWKVIADISSTVPMLPKTSGDIRSCIAFHSKMALAWGNGEDVKARIDILPEFSHAIQVRTTLMGGATRLEEARVVEILCDESP